MHVYLLSWKKSETQKCSKLTVLSSAVYSSQNINVSDQFNEQCLACAEKIASLICRMEPKAENKDNN